MDYYAMWQLETYGNIIDDDATDELENGKAANDKGEKKLEDEAFMHLEDQQH